MCFVLDVDFGDLVEVEWFYEVCDCVYVEVVCEYIEVGVV